MTISWRRAGAFFAAVSTGVAAILTVALAIANGTSASLPSLVELLVAMTWISGVVHGVVAVAVGTIWGVGRLALRQRWNVELPRLLLCGLIAFDVAWILWNRLGMAHQYVSVRPFLTWAGVLENLALIAMVVLVGVVGLGTRRMVRGLAAGAVLALIAGTLVWNSREEGQVRTYSMERVREAARRGAGEEAAAGPSHVSGGAPLIVLGFDGMNWSTLVPLLEIGVVPNLARLVRDGTCGYLDNGDESLSARIWSTVFSGHPPEEHGILGFTKLVLPRSGATFSNLLLHRPSIDTFYGLGHLLAKVPSPGLWSVEQMGSTDREVKMLWDVVSEHEKRVVVANAITNVPVRPVNGAIIEYRQKADASNAFPKTLAARWNPTPHRDPTGRTPEGFEDHHRRLREEVAFSLELFREHDVDLGIYYTHFLDTASHWNWDFHSRGRFLLDDLPNGLEDEVWEELVQRHHDDPAFRAYRLLDVALGEFLRAHPRSVFLVCSDHGWTYSGYEHFGAPDGVFLLAGPGVRKGGTLDACRIEDVTPTVLGLLGVPIAEVLPGRFLAEAFEEPPLLLSREAYGAPVHGEVDETAVDPEELERLRALGYLN